MSAVSSSWPCSGDDGHEAMTVNPDGESLPLVFRFTKSVKSDAFRFTTAASYFMNKELCESPTLKMCWRVSFSQDEEACVLKNPRAQSKSQAQRITNKTVPVAIKPQPPK